MTVVQVPVESMNRVLALLGSMPYNQVAEIVEDLRANSQLVSVGEEEAEEATEE